MASVAEFASTALLALTAVAVTAAARRFHPRRRRGHEPAAHGEPRIRKAVAAAHRQDLVEAIAGEEEKAVALWGKAAEEAQRELAGGAVRVVEQEVAAAEPARRGMEVVDVGEPPAGVSALAVVAMDSEEVSGAVRRHVELELMGVIRTHRQQREGLPRGGLELRRQPRQDGAQGVPRGDQRPPRPAIHHPAPAVPIAEPCRHEPAPSRHNQGEELPLLRGIKEAQPPHEGHRRHARRRRHAARPGAAQDGDRPSRQRLAWPEARQAPIGVEGAGDVALAALHQRQLAENAHMVRLPCQRPAQLARLAGQQAISAEEVLRGAAHRRPIPASGQTIPPPRIMADRATTTAPTAPG